VTLNGETFRKRTDDIVETYMSLKPDVLKTNVIIKLTSKGNQSEKVLYLPQGRRSFVNRVAAEILARDLTIAFNE
jgi:hypothetical protein